VERQEFVRLLRPLLADIIANACAGEIAVATSGGVDSSSIVLAAMDAGFRPAVVSFTLDNWGSADFLAARKLAAHFGLDFLPVFLPSDPETIAQDLQTLVRDWGARKKTSIECLWPFKYVLERLRANGLNTLVAGSAADGHFALSKKAMIHCREPKEAFQAFRRDYFSQADPAQTRTLSRVARDAYGVAAISPYTDPRVFDLFADDDWDSLNRPRQKEAIRREFPELDALRLKPHTNLQLGDSRIAETVGRSAVAYFAPHAKSPVAAYNVLNRQLR